MKWVYELPLEIRNEILRDAVNILTECCGDEVDLFESIDIVMREKLVNIIGDEKGLLDADKYSKYLWM